MTSQFLTMMLLARERQRSGETNKHIGRRAGCSYMRQVVNEMASDTHTCHVPFPKYNAPRASSFDGVSEVAEDKCIAQEEGQLRPCRIFRHKRQKRGPRRLCADVKQAQRLGHVNTSRGLQMRSKTLVISLRSSSKVIVAAYLSMSSTRVTSCRQTGAQRGGRGRGRYDMEEGN